MGEKINSKDNIEKLGKLFENDLVSGGKLPRRVFVHHFIKMDCVLMKIVEKMADVAIRSYCDMIPTI